jgi:TRAP-type uncharacterized transport system substrate-binding protein
MTLQDLALLSRRGRIRMGIVVFVMIVAAVWAAAHFLEPAPPRHIVLASGSEDGLTHEFAQRYIEILARAGVTVEERITVGPGQNLQLLEDPHSGVDVAFVQGGIAKFPEANDVVMLATLYYVPMWIFYRDTETLPHIRDLRGRRVAVAVRGSGVRSLTETLFKLNRLSSDNVTIVSLSNSAALIALKSGEIDAAIFVDGAKSQSVSYALNEPNLRLFSFGHADAYTRLLPYIVKLTLPPGVIDVARNIPDKEVQLIATKEMLAARDSLHPALIGLLVDAAREIHGDQGVFRKSGEFPQTTKVDLRVSSHAEQHSRSGASFFYRYLPFWVATIVERAIIILLPIAVVLFPLFHFLPQLLRWHVRSRIYRWYGELALLERDVATRSGALPAAKWLADLDRIERSVARINTPAGFASEAYTLRQHIDFVRRAVMARTNLPLVAQT